MSRTVVLSDEEGNATGSMDLLAAHTGSGALHRAFSVYVFDPGRTKLLIQRRSVEKMLWPGVWANTCCSHPFENEHAKDAGMRRLKEELGFTCPLQEGLSFVYRAEDPAGHGVEHEHVTTLIGEVEETVQLSPDLQEVAEWKWVEIRELLKDFEKKPEAYAPWFTIGLRKLLDDRK